MFITKIYRNTSSFKVQHVDRKTTLKVIEHVTKLMAIGKRGVPGTSGDKHFTKNFTALAEVTVDHNLGKYPSLSIFDSAGDEVIGAVEHVSLNQLIVRFSAALTGKVACN